MGFTWLLHSTFIPNGSSFFVLWGQRQTLVFPFRGPEAPTLSPHYIEPQKVGGSQNIWSRADSFSPLSLRPLLQVPELSTSAINQFSFYTKKNKTFKRAFLNHKILNNYFKSYLKYIYILNHKTIIIKKPFSKQ